MLQGGLIAAGHDQGRIGVDHRDDPRAQGMSTPAG
jgi:hypothetical protein